jgi:hypothetical protein
LFKLLEILCKLLGARVVKGGFGSTVSARILKLVEHDECLFGRVYRETLSLCKTTNLFIFYT